MAIFSSQKYRLNVPNAITLGVLILSSGLQAAPVVSEFLARNQSSLQDEDNDSSDWIEIHNPDTTPLDLSGYALTDDSAVPQKWTLPPGTTLAANDYLIVFASGKDRKNTNPLHANFALAASGGYLALTDPNGLVVSEFSDYPEQRSDISYGIGPAGDEAFFNPPTPGSANGNPLAGFVADTTFTKKRGFYDAFFIAEINTATPGASIRYTFDGSKPTATNGTLYGGSFLITSSTVIRAIAYKEGMIPTNVDAQSYLFTSDIVNQDEMNPAITASTTYRDELPDSLKSLPVVSLSFQEDDVFGPTGIYENPNLRGRVSEREIHFEYFDPANPDDSVHTPAGMRIHGGNSRLHPKKPLRISFRDDYGDARLEHDLFPDSSVRSFKTLLLRGGGHDAWTFDDRWDQASFIRNQFLHQLQRDMGQTSPHGRHVNVFLNGQYWGLYELQEFPHEHYNADHHGGDPDDWDVVKHGQEVEAGDREAWDALIVLAERGIRSSSQYEAIQEYLDLENFADAMIQRIWASDQDWLAPYFLDGFNTPSFIEDKNWYVARKSRNGTSKFYFYNWDSEMSMGIPFNRDRTFEYDFSRVNNFRSPGQIYEALRQYPEFQLFFADRLQKHFFQNGTFTILPLTRVWDRYVASIHSPVVAESARWGVQAWSDEDRPFPFTRDDQWLPAVDWVRNQFIPNRTGIVFNQFRAVGLYPAIDAPLITPFQTVSTTPIQVQLTSNLNEATIYYTTDGCDPRTPGETSEIILVGDDSPVQVIVPTAAINSEIGISWIAQAPPSNINDWITGQNGVGFDQGADGGYRPFIATNLDDMWGQNASAYLRYEFVIPDQATLENFNSLTLDMRADDGFAAYLNGALVARKNFGTSAWNSPASTSTPDEEAILFTPFDLTSQIVQLTVGTNVLAIHGQNFNVQNNDFFIEALLTSRTTSQAAPSSSALPYTQGLPIDRSSVIKSRVLDSAGRWSALSETYFSIASPASSANLLVSEIHYHPLDATSPEEIATSTNKDDYEFLELLNTSYFDLDLSNCRFDRGLTFTFPQGSLIPPGSRRVIVSNRAAFLARYGSELADQILGEFDRSSKLSNGGETLSLVNPDGALIFSFSYDDESPWPTEADGRGPSLVLRDARAFLTSLGQATLWRPSSQIHGTPGEVEDLTFAQWALNTYGSSSDPGTLPSDFAPGETETNLILYSQGRDLAGGPFWTTSTISEEGLQFQTFTYQVRSSLPGSSVIPEVSHDLTTWERSAVILSQIPRADGTTLVTIRPPNPVADGQKIFFRLAASMDQ